MPWEVTIINGTPDSRKPLGTRDEVIAALASALPGVALRRPPTPPQEFLDMMPQAVREAMTRPKLEADFEHEDYSMQFYAADAPQILSINVEVRGNGDPLPSLRSVCADTSWSVLDVGEDRLVDLEATDASSWERFREWRDKSIRDIERDDEAE